MKQITRFNQLFSGKLQRQRNENKKAFQKRCKQQTTKYKHFMKTRWNSVQPTLTQRMVQEEVYMTAKWDKKHPKQEGDLFNPENSWERKRELAIEHIRDVIVSRHDKLVLIGRFKISENEYTEREIAKIKDIHGEGHRVNELGQSAKLITIAQKITNEVRARYPSLVCSNLKDHERRRGRIILPTAA